jgi:hypothetical protein
MGLPETIRGQARAYRTCMRAALGALLGVLLSGPIAVVLVNATHPQPSWQDAGVFARAYHPVQLLPYLGGIVLVTALIVLIAGIHAVAGAGEKARTTAALLFGAVFGAFIFFNYVAQTTFLPELARVHEPSSAPLIGALSMSNPTSLAWGIEMWGWGFFGVATWLASAAFARTGLERATALAFFANGPVSILGALWTVARPGWVMSPAGLAAFGAWNLLLALLAVLAFLTFRRRLAQASGRAVTSGG